MPQQKSVRAANRIWHLWLSGEVTADLPADEKPSTRPEGYAIQAEMDALSGRTRKGWKIAATSVAGQRHIGVDGPIAGRIFAARLLTPGAAISLTQNRMRVVEPEFAFSFGRALAPRATPYSVDEVMAAVEHLHLAFEVPDSRFADFARVGGATLIADNACAHELMVGPPVQADWRAIVLAKHAVSARVGTRYTRTGSGALVLGDPRVALCWIVNELSGLGIPMAAGEFVTTGTCMPPLEVLPGDSVHADFGTLGQIEVSVAR